MPWEFCMISGWFWCNATDFDLQGRLLAQLTDFGLAQELPEGQTFIKLIAEMVLSERERERVAEPLQSPLAMYCLQKSRCKTGHPGQILKVVKFQSFQGWTKCPDPMATLPPRQDCTRFAGTMYNTFHIHSCKQQRDRWAAMGFIQPGQSMQCTSLLFDVLRQTRLLNLNLMALASCCR